jgi:hypothetical protein
MNASPLLVQAQGIHIAGSQWERLARYYRNWYNAPMEKVVRKFHSHAESDRADPEYYLSLTPEQGMDIMLELVARYRESFDDEARQGLKRVYRVIKLGER